MTVSEVRGRKFEVMLDSGRDEFDGKGTTLALRIWSIRIGSEDYGRAITLRWDSVYSLIQYC